MLIAVVGMAGLYGRMFVRAEATRIVIYAYAYVYIS